MVFTWSSARRHTDHRRRAEPGQGQFTVHTSAQYTCSHVVSQKIMKGDLLPNEVSIVNTSHCCCCCCLTQVSSQHSLHQGCAPMRHLVHSPMLARLFSMNIFCHSALPRASTSHLFRFIVGYTSEIIELSSILVVIWSDYNALVSAYFS